jgi:Xaa-Pro aminopeptidase
MTHAPSSILMYADTMRSPDMRSVVPHAVADPFLYLEHDGRRLVVVRSLELARMAEVPDLEPHADEEFGLDELRRSGVPAAELPRRVAIAACRALGVTSAAVPPGFPLGMADALRAAGVELVVDDYRFEMRRRAKTATQIEGIRRAQRAAEAAVAAVAAALHSAEIRGEELLEPSGEALTCESLQRLALAAFIANGASADELIIAHGEQTCIGHHRGSGAIRVGEPITVDLWPRDDQTGCFTDMTRTFVVGTVDEELGSYHACAREALALATAAIAPGVRASEVHRIACAVFEAAGYPTQLTKEPGTVLLDGFFHSLGHGVGLEVHEAPHLAAGEDVLVEGDVLAVEPGCYRQGFGGVRLEDLVLVTASGCEVFTDYPYELAP